MGELFRLIAPSPSRFITLSELLQFYFGGLSYALIEKHVPSGKNLEFKDHVVVLYGGGDDIAVYGSWLPVVYYIIVLRIGMDRTLYPLTATIPVISSHVTTLREGAKVQENSKHKSKPRTTAYNNK